MIGWGVSMGRGRFDPHIEAGLHVDRYIRKNVKRSNIVE